MKFHGFSGLLGGTPESRQCTAGVVKYFFWSLNNEPWTMYHEPPALTVRMQTAKIQKNREEAGHKLEEMPRSLVAPLKKGFRIQYVACGFKQGVALQFVASCTSIKHDAVRSTWYEMQRGSQEAVLNTMQLTSSRVDYLIKHFAIIQLIILWLAPSAAGPWPLLIALRLQIMTIFANGS